MFEKLKLLIQKVVLNLRLDLTWLWSAPLPLSERIIYLFRKYRSILSNKNRIVFLGSELQYDNRFTPALLTDYVFEFDFLLKKFDQTKIETVLDIGANIGQFSFVLKYFRPSAKVYSFEPNPTAYNLLIQNSKKFGDWHALNFGVGSHDGHAQLYFVPGKSGQGSIYAENAGRGLLNSELTKVNFSILSLNPTKLSALNMPKHFDLIKIDVEGAESEVIKGLNSVSWTLLYIEFSENRSGSTSLEDSLELIKTHTGQSPEILWISEATGASPTRQALLRSQAH